MTHAYPSDVDSIVRYPKDEGDPAEVILRLHGAELVLALPASGEGELLELRLLPGFEPLTPTVLRRFMPRAPLFLECARRLLQHRFDDAEEAMRALREIGATRRGYSDDFIRIIGKEHRALVAEGERYPIKALAEAHSVA